MKLHVLTACSRPENLQTVAESITAATCAEWEVHWHVTFDLEKRHVGGQGMKNLMLDEVTDGWVFILDDDTVMHPDLLTRTAEPAKTADAIVVSQERSTGRILDAAPANLRVGAIDGGQALLRRDLIGLERFPNVYVGDGLFLENVLTTGHIEFIPEVLSWHNRLRPSRA